MKNQINFAELTFEEKWKAFGAKPMSEEELRQSKIFRKKGFFKEKYLNGLRRLTRMDMRQLRLDHPSWHLKNILAELLKDYSPELPPQVLLMMTQFIVEEWEKVERRELVAA